MQAFAYSRARERMPDTRAGMLACSGLDVGVVGGGLWPCQEASGSLLDVSGNGNHLPELGGGAPTKVVRRSRRVARGNAGAVSWGASISWPAANVSFAVFAWSSFVDTGAYAIMRLITSLAGTELTELYLPDDLVGVYTADGTGFTTLTRNLANYPVKDDVPYFAVAQYDWSGTPTKRVAWSRGGGTIITAESPLTGWDGIATNANVYVGGNVAGGSTTWTGQTTGAQCEGASFCTDLIRRMGA